MKCLSKYWANKAVKMWRECLMLGAGWGFGGKCIVNNEITPCGGRLNWHHLISRTVKHLRHDVFNAVPLCAKHHMFCRQISAHGAPGAFYDFLYEKYPKIRKWVNENKWKIEPADYEADYKRLEDLKTKL